ncbi:MAG: Trk system potassium transporter TrkA [Deltaproteobacteria bacterium]|nr:Trk system potassium transporter TrkA [Deltaproteobacteria bacterium]
MRVVIVGAGQVGFAIAERLTFEKHEVVLVDRDAGRLGDVAGRLDVAAVEGTGCSPVVLRRTGIETAGLVIAVTDSDEVNLLACLIAGRLAPGAMRVARVRDPEYHADPEVFRGEPFGLASAINPEEEAARRIARAVSAPGALDVIPLLGGRVLVLGLRIEAGSPPAGRTLTEIRPLATVQMRVACIEHRGTLTIPRGPDRMEAGDIAYVACRSEDAAAVLRFAGKSGQPVRRVMIFGAEDLATYLAMALSAARISVKILSSDAERCRVCAERVPQALVVQGDGTDPEVLREEGIDAIDAFVACSRHEERNIPAALLAKSLGARLAMVAAASATYEHLAPSIGIDAATSPQSAVVGSILQLVRRGRILGVHALWSRDAEVIELQALEASKLVAVPLKDTGFPQGAMVLAVARGDAVLVPHGDTVIVPGDRVVTIVERRIIHKVEKLFTGRSDSLPPARPNGS